MSDFANFLRWSNQGSDLFLRTVRAMSDDEFTESSSLPNWTKAKVIAHVAFNALAINNLVHWAISGIETPMYRSTDERAEQLERGVEMTTTNLRELLLRADQDLSRNFSDLDDTSLNSIVVTAQGRQVPASELPWMRAKEVWIHAVDLDSSLTFADFPKEFVDALLANIVQQRQIRPGHPSLVLELADRERRWSIGENTQSATTIHGNASEVASWLAGRKYDNLTTDAGLLPEIGPWF